MLLRIRHFKCLSINEIDPRKYFLEDDKSVFCQNLSGNLSARIRRFDLPSIFLAERENQASPNDFFTKKQNNNTIPTYNAAKG